MLHLGILQTHVHLLVRMHPTTQLPRLLQRLKGASAVLAGRRGPREWSNVTLGQGIRCRIGQSAGGIDG